MEWLGLLALLVLAVIAVGGRFLRTRYDVRSAVDLRNLVYARLTGVRFDRRRITLPAIRRAFRQRVGQRLRERFAALRAKLPGPRAKPSERPPLRPPFQPGIQQLRSNIQRFKWLLAALLVLAVAFAALVALRGTALVRATPPADAFVVRIAPFAVPGQDSRQGRLLAAQLVDVIRPQIPATVDIGVLNDAVMDAQTAVEAAQRGRIDVLIWGSAAEGMTATQPGLRPQVAWLPAAPWVPGTWPGVDGRFALAPTYDLALEPLNGAVVLPLAVNSIAYLSGGDVAQAAVSAETLLRDYGPQVRGDLPATVLMLNDWALGVYDAAEAQTRTALQAAERAEHWNNLGVVLEDRSDVAGAEVAFGQAIALASQWAHGHAGLARRLLAQQRTGEALDEARVAAQLAPNNAAFAALLGTAQRGHGHLQAARATFADLVRADPNNTGARAEQAVLGLTDVATATGRLEWELIGAPVRSADELTAVHGEIERSIAALEARRAQWLQAANAHGVAGQIMLQRVAEGAAARLQAEQHVRRYDLLLVQIEAGKLDAAQARGAWARLWDGLRGKRTPLQAAQATAAALRERLPARQYDLLVQEGHAAYAGGDVGAAQAAWDAAQASADAARPGDEAYNRPDARYGQALVSLAANNRAEARARFDAALAADSRFFPAHQQLAVLAEADGVWPEAERHHRWLAEQRPWDAAGALGLARALQAQTRLAEAERVLLPLANAGNADALIMLATIYRTAERLDEAEQVLARAFTFAPNRADLHEERAAIALARGDWQAAEAELQQALTLDEARTSARITLGQLYVERLNQPAAAVAQLQRAVRTEPNNGNAQRWLGEALLGTDRADAAVAAFERALAAAPNDVAARHGLGQAYVRLGRLDEASAAEQQALDVSNGTFVPAWIGLGNVFERQQRFDEANARYNAALHRDPAAADAYAGLARIAVAQGNGQAAIEYYRRGLAQAPQNVPLLVALGDQLLQTNATQEALDVFEQAKAIAPNDPQVHRGLGRALWQAGRGDEALAELDQARRIDADDADTLLLAGDIQAALNRTDAALDAYSRAARARADWYEPQYRRGVLLLQQAQTDEAISALERSVELNPQFGQGAYWLGRAYRAASRSADAERMLRRAIELQPNYHEARFFLAQTLDEAGRSAEARDVYSTIVADAPPTDPWRAEAQQALNQ
jgi:tetratricopeptide (TPR) repeat protein